MTGNTALSGGAVFVLGSVNGTNSTYTSNSAQSRGGALLSYGTMNFNNTSFVNNSCVGSGKSVNNYLFGIVCAHAKHFALTSLN
jgi:hypothetical protein